MALLRNKQGMVSSKIGSLKRFQLRLSILQSAFCECRIANCPPEAPPEVDSPQAKDPPLAEKCKIEET